MLGKLVSDPDARVRRSVFCALSRIRERKAHSCSGEPLRIFAAESEICVDRRRRICVSIRMAEGQILRAISPLQFLLTQGQELISEYSVQENLGPDAFTLGVAVPWIDESNSPYRKIYEEGSRLSRPWARRQDQWLLVDYEPESPAMALAKVMSEICQKNPERHALLVVCPELHPAPLDPIDYDKLLARAKCAGIRIHGLILGSEIWMDKQLQRLCRATGGWLMRCLDCEAAPHVLQDWTASLLSSYQITCIPSALASSPLSLQVYAAGGYGSLLDMDLVDMDLADA